MASTKSKRHVHKYARVDTPNGKIWRCYKPDCTHYLPKHQEWLIEGRYTECWKCHKDCIIGALQIDLDKPFCDECLGVSNPMNDSISPALQALLKQKGVM